MDEDRAVVTCPSCHKERVVSIQQKNNIKLGRSSGKCTACANRRPQRMTDLAPWRTPDYAVFRWHQEDVREWPWKFNEKVTLDYPLCFRFFSAVEEDPEVEGGIRSNVTMCIKPLGHDDGAHEPVTSLAVISAPGLLVDGMVDAIATHTIAAEPVRVNGVKFEPTWRYKVRDGDGALLHVYEERAAKPYLK